MVLSKYKGFSTSNILFAVLIAGLILIFSHREHMNNEAINLARTTPPPISVGEKLLIDKFKNKNSPKNYPKGRFYGKGESEDGMSYEFTYFFGEDQTLSKDVLVMDKYYLSGTAKYNFTGSVLSFSDIKGDKYLFSEIGEAITVLDQDSITVYDEQSSITLKSPKLIDEENKAEQDRKKALEARPFSELTIHEMISRLINNYWYLMVILIIPILLLSFYRFYRDQY